MMTELLELIEKLQDLDCEGGNRLIEDISGIVNYFSEEAHMRLFIKTSGLVFSSDNDRRVTYGDWQTPPSLSKSICVKYLKRYGCPDVVIEPTCGVGSFVFSAIEVFPTLSEIYALEINSEYTARLKYQLLKRALTKPADRHPKIFIYNVDYFKFDFSEIADRISAYKWHIGIIGNPPWVTNSRQGRDRTANLPIKSNTSGFKGIDAITGKSNFDISEYITLKMLEIFGENKGGISFLLKNSVIRNILFRQNTFPLHIKKLRQENIDTKREFNVSVDASCFFAELGNADNICEVSDFYTDNSVTRYGWTGDYFVADVDEYSEVSQFDGMSPYEWRSGVKHDCTSVLELSIVDGNYCNELGEKVDIEPDMVYPLLKSSDIGKYGDIYCRKYVVLPQRFVGESNLSLSLLYPKTYAYLHKHLKYFESRKSSIYKGKEKFSIFGIGDYSFKPYKIAVSSLYKNVVFRLIKPINGKPVMLDDTCYQLGFDSFEEAESVFLALRSREIQKLIKAISFSDAKRVVTKGLLMRLDLSRFFNYKNDISPEKIKKVCSSKRVIQPSLFDSPELS